MFLGQGADAYEPEAGGYRRSSEVVAGINILDKTGNAENLKEELGDLLLQVMFHAVMAEEEGVLGIRSFDSYYTINGMLNFVIEK